MVNQVGADDEALLTWHCPGCGYGHFARLTSDNPKATLWKWNGSLSKPTFSPSIIVRSQYLCHMVIASGVCQFLPDCTHHLAGKTVVMEPA